MTFRAKMWTTTGLIAALWGGVGAIFTISPLQAAGASATDSLTAVHPHPGAMRAGVVAFAMVLGCAMVGGVAAGSPPVPENDSECEGLDEEPVTQDFGSPNLASSPDHYEPANLLQTLLDSSPDLIYFKDRASRFVAFSRSFRELLRLDDASVLKGKTDFDFFAEEHARPAFEDEQEIIRTGRPLIGKLERETHTDGRVTWALTTKLPWRNQSGQIIGTFGISKNVTEFKETELKLAYEQGLFQTLLDNIPDAIYFKDLESRFVRASHSTALKTLSRTGSGPQSADCLIGLSDFDLFGEEHARQAFADEQNLMRTGEPIVGKLEQENYANGSTTWCLSTKLPWRDKDGKIIGTFGISKDITPLKEAEARLEETNKRLAHTSRMAGMAEVATDVLHNVGNVLNSVNVSCSVVIDRVESSSLDNLARIPAMLREQAGQLDQFLTHDPRGKQIPDYLAAVATDFAAQRRFLLAELNQLRTHIDHIKQVVAMQQNYAKVSGVCEIIAVEKLVADALQINVSALDRHSVTLRKAYESVPPILVDKHKVLQILVNLISNAKYAVSHRPHSDKLMTLRIAPDGSDHVLIQVQDNGAGIPPENLTRIFGHGFTTRHDGHGFGLHSGALAARELGGALTAHSDGPGHGATFTLRLPLKPQPPAAA